MKQKLSESDLSWTMTIRPEASLLNVHLTELWRYRDLIMLFVWRDFVSVYKQTILGPLWYLVQAVLTAATFTFVFGRVGKISTDDLPQFLFYMAGIVLWRYFSDCLTKTSTTFTSNANIFGKVYFPRLVMPISIVLSSMIALGIQFLQFLGFLAYFWLKGSPVHPNVAVLLTPFLVLIIAGQGFGFGIIISALTTRYRDLQYLARFGIQLFMYVTPVIYPVSALPEKMRWLALANPIAPVMEAFRYAFLGKGYFSAGALLYSAGFMILTILVGTVLFNRIERTFMDTV